MLVHLANLIALQLYTQVCVCKALYSESPFYWFHLRQTHTRGTLHINFPATWLWPWPLHLLLICAWAPTELPPLHFWFFFSLIFHHITHSSLSFSGIECCSIVMEGELLILLWLLMSTWSRFLSTIHVFGNFWFLDLHPVPFIYAHYNLIFPNPVRFYVTLSFRKVCCSPLLCRGWVKFRKFLKLSDITFFFL